MTLLYVITRANRGGAQTNVLALACAAKAAGHAVTVACGESGWLGDRLAEVGVRFVVLKHLHRSWQPIEMWLYVRELRAWLNREAFNVVHFHSSNAMVGAFARRSGSQDGRLKPSGTRRTVAVATVHGWSLLAPGWQGSLMAKTIYRLMMRTVLRRMDLVIFVSEADAAFGRASGLVEAGASIVIHNGIAPYDRYLSRRAARDAMERDVGLKPDSTLVVGTIARPVYAKNLELFEEVAMAVPEARFVIVSDVDEPRALLKGFDVFLLTSRFEGLPYTLLEAADAGVPIVATDVGGVRELIEDGVTGRLVASGDREGLVAAVREALGDVARAEAGQAAAARAKIVADFSEIRMVERTLALYVSLRQAGGKEPLAVSH